MRKSLLLTSILVLGLAMLIGSSLLKGHAAGGPTISVTNVYVNPNTVCLSNDAGGVTLNATVNGTFDNDSDTTVFGNPEWANISQITSPCSQTVNQQRTATRTVTTYTNKKFVIDGSDYPSSGSPVTYTRTYSVSSPDGKYTLTVTALSSEDKTVTTYTRTDYRNKSGSTITNYCEGTFAISSGPTPTTLTSSQASSNVSYIRDEDAPTVTDTNIAPGNHIVHQTGSVLVSAEISGGSAGTSYTVTATATSADNPNYSYTDTRTGSFQPASSSTGIANVEHYGPVSVSIPCDAPLGTYNIQVTVQTQDLCGNAYPELTANAGTIQVIPLINLVTETAVLSEFTGGQYGLDQCFTGTKQGKNINTNPGSMHIASIVHSAGPCVGFQSFSGGTVTLTLPTDFSYMLTGASPAAHVFLGDAGGGFDLHNGTPLAEVTSLVTQSLSGQIITINLSGLGTQPANYTVFVRAHCKYSGTTAPQANSVFTFLSSASLSIDGFGAITDGTSASIVGNPTGGCNNGSNP